MPRPRRKPVPLDDPHKPIDPRKPFTMREAVDTVTGGPKRRRLMIRTPEELAQTVWFQIRFDAVSMELIRIHAMMRRVKPTVLVSDILNCWLANSTDYSQAVVGEMLPRGARAAVVPERWSGYLASLGYAPALEEQLPPDPPEIPEGLRPRLHADLTPKRNVEPPDDTPLPDPEPVEPLTPAAPSEVRDEQPDPGLSTEEAMRRMNLETNPQPQPDGEIPSLEWNPLVEYGSRPFDPEEYAREAAPLGHGSAAQNITMGKRLGPDGRTY